jgi:hypothetical protein
MNHLNNLVFNYLKYYDINLFILINNFIHLNLN